MFRDASVCIHVIIKEDESSANRIVSDYFIKWVLEELSPNKAAGSEVIVPKMLQSGLKPNVPLGGRDAKSKHCIGVRSKRPNHDQEKDHVRYLEDNKIISRVLRM